MTTQGGLAGVKRLSQAHVRQRNRLEAVAYADNSQGVTRCADCRWSYRGRLGDGRKAWRAHRERKHS